jgi:cytochrome c oxidase subunit I+III
VFPLFAAFYYWMPYASRRPLSERIGRWVFGLMFAGFNIAFFPMHFTGMAGMPRRVHTYPEGLGWEVLNLVSTLGAFMIAVAVLLFLIDVARNFRMAGERNAGDVWKAGSLEWLPSGNYSNRSIPIVSSREPLWDQPGLARDVEAGAYYLPGTATGRRETIVTSAIDARPQYLLLMPMPGWPPVLSAVFTAAFFLLLTAKLVAASVACGIVAVALILRWLWDTDLGVVHAPVDIGGGIRLPVYATGRQSHSLWASGILALVSGSLYASLVMSYLYLWSSGRDGWPAPSALPSGVAAIASTVLLLLCIVLIRAAGSMLAGRSGTAAVVAGLLATVALCAAFGIDLQAHLATGLDPRESAYGAIVYAVQCVQGFFVAVAVLMSAYTLARGLAGKVDAVRRVTFDNTAWMGRYVSIQGLAGVMLLHLFPRLA